MKDRAGRISLPSNEISSGAHLRGAAQKLPNEWPKLTLEYFQKGSNSHLLENRRNKQDGQRKCVASSGSRLSATDAERWSIIPLMLLPAVLCMLGMPAPGDCVSVARM